MASLFEAKQKAAGALAPAPVVPAPRASLAQARSTPASAAPVQEPVGIFSDEAKAEAKRRAAQAADASKAAYKKVRESALPVLRARIRAVRLPSVPRKVWMGVAGLAVLGVAIGGVYWGGLWRPSATVAVTAPAAPAAPVPAPVAVAPVAPSPAPTPPPVVKPDPTTPTPVAVVEAPAPVVPVVVAPVPRAVVAPPAPVLPPKPAPVRKPAKPAHAAAAPTDWEKEQNKHLDTYFDRLKQRPSAAQKPE